MFKTTKNKVIMLGALSVALIFALVVIVINVTGNGATIEELPVTDEFIRESETPNTTTTTTSAATSTPPTTTTFKVTSTLPEITIPPVTTTTKINVTLTPEMPVENIVEVWEESNIEATTTTQQTQTTPPLVQKNPDSTTFIDGQKYTWDPVIGWIKTSGDGATIIMDVEDDGRRYEGGW